MADLNYNSSEALVKPSQVRCVLGVTSDNIAKLVDSSQLVGMDLWQEYFGEGTQGGGSVQFVGNMSKLSDLGTSQDAKYRENHYPNCQSVIDYVQNVRSQLNSQISNVSNSSLSKENLTTETDLSTVDDSKNKIPSVYSVVEYVKTHGSEGPQGPQGAAGKNGAQGPQGAQGAPGNIVGNYDSVEDLPEEGTIGAVYLVNGKLYVYVGSGGDTKNGKYQSMNDITGPQGPQGYQGRQGAQGVQGKVGSQGVQGHQGNQGSQGPQGVTGAQRLDGNGVNTVTVIQNLPIDKRNIIVNLSTATPGVLSVTSGLAEGSELQIRVNNNHTTAITLEIPSTDSYQISPNMDDSYEIEQGGFLELSIWFINNKYVIRVLD